jgi:hypothetical protein
MLLSGVLIVLFLAACWLYWLASRGPRRSRSWAAAQPRMGMLAPPKGPDDDPEFLRELDRRIHGTSADSNETAA